MVNNREVRSTPGHGLAEVSDQASQANSQGCAALCLASNALISSAC